MLLIIDSEKVPDTKIIQTFNDLGYQSVEVAKSAEQARNILKSNEESKSLNKIILIIINSDLPDADGFELCREFKKTETGQSAYILVIISSEENKTAIEKVRHSGATDFSVKPYQSADFQRHFFKFSISKTVLLIEDDPVIRQTVRAILYKYDMELIEVDDGLKAYNLINTMLPVRIVLMDIGLPNMNGIQLVEHIRSKAIWRKTPVVMLTGSTDVLDVKKCLSAGASQYIAKPFKVDDFINHLVKYLPDAS